MGFKGITITTSEESLGNITAADDAAIFQSLIGSDGVLNIGSKFATTVISNNKVRVADGVMCVGGHMGRTAYGDYNDMTIENGVSGQNRNDIIYAKFLTSGSADTFTLDVKKGTGTTGTATDPALTQGVLYENATLREFPLWRVKLKGLSIVAVEQMFTLVPTIPELEAKFNELNSNLGYEIYHQGNNYVVTKNENTLIIDITALAFKNGSVSSESFIIPTEFYPKKTKVVSACSITDDNQHRLALDTNGQLYSFLSSGVGYTGQLYGQIVLTKNN